MKKRDEMNKQYQWNVQSMYKNEEIWEKDFLEMRSKIKIISSYKNKLKNGASTLKEALDINFEVERKLEYLFTFAHLKHDEDIANEDNKIMFERILTLHHHYEELNSFLIPEILELPKDLLKSYLEDRQLEKYTFLLTDLIRKKEHYLSSEEEQIIALSQDALQTSYSTFSSFNNVDIDFPSIMVDGEEKKITHGSYFSFLINQNREIRKNAFKAYHQEFDKFSQTLCSLLQGTVKSNKYITKARKYDSCLQTSLFEDNIDTAVYKNVIKKTRDNIDKLHRYMRIKKEILNVDELHLYDVYVPLIKTIDKKIKYSDAVELLLESVKILGEEYTSVLEKGLKNDSWVDVYENANKRSGAYSSGCYDSYPFILLNYTDTLDDAFTLAHEAGHSMHTYFANKNNDYIYSNYPIFLAEIASTFNEQLLAKLLLEKSQNNDEKLYIIGNQIEDIRTTLFRQVMFAEFELFINECVENDIPLTVELLKSQYRKLNEFYFGEEVIVDPEVEIEWGRIPHFYYNFYVYKYATGLASSISLYDKVINGNDEDKNQYISLLKAGGSDFPLNILSKAGIEITEAKPIEDAILKFDKLLDNFENLL